MGNTAWQLATEKIQNSAAVQGFASKENRTMK